MDSLRLLNYRQIFSVYTIGFTLAGVSNNQALDFSIRDIVTGTLKQVDCDGAESRKSKVQQTYMDLMGTTQFYVTY